MASIEFNEKIKKSFTMKKAIKLLTIVGGLALIVFMTVANVTLDPTHVNWQTYLTNSLILVGIMVFGLVMGESVGDDRQTEKRGGLYQTNLGLYHEAKESISEIEIYFEQFYLWFKEKSSISKRVDFLVDNGFDQAWAKAIVDCITLDDIDRLTKQSVAVERNGKKIIVKRIAVEQAEAVRAVLNGSVKVNAPSYSYYLSAYGKATRSYVLEQEREITKDIRINKGAGRGLKIISSLAISALWAMVTVNDFMDGDSAQAWLNLISRITSFITSFSSGWGTSVVNVKLQALLLENKATVLKYFRDCTDKKEFTPKTYEEEARAIWEQEEKERKEAEASVVTPEIIETPLLEQKEIKNI